MTLGILVCLWRRPALAAAMLRHTRSVAPPGTILVAVISPEDPDLHPTVPGVEYVEAPNDPRGAKWNAGLRWLRDRVDAVTILGSDDFAPAEYLAWAARPIGDHEIRGTRSCVVWRPADERCIRWLGYPASSPRHGETIGSGRTISRGLLDIMDWRLWGDLSSTGLDADMTRRLAALRGHYSVEVAPPELAPIIDVKSDPDVDIGSLESMTQNSEPARIDDVAPAVAAALRPLLDPVRAMPRLWNPNRADPPLLSAVLMVRDEAWMLPRCLLSLSGCVDEVTVAVDSRTTDRTREIARAAGCRVFDVEWNGFGPTRTKSLRLARGTWGLVIDADEVIVRGETLRTALADAPDELDGMTVSMRCGSLSGQTIGSEQVRVVRLDRASYTKRRHNRLEGIARVAPSAAVIRTTYQGRTPESIEASIADMLEDWSDAPDAQTAYLIGHAFLGLGKLDAARAWAEMAVSMDADSLAGAAAWLDLIHTTGALDGPEAADLEVSRCLATHPQLADAWRIRLSATLLKWAQAACSPGRYAAVPQATLPEHIAGIPAIVDALSLPVRIEFGHAAHPPQSGR